MAVNDITLTSAMRSNLVNLQQTADFMSRTQTRLSSGKKVNSAIDSPVNFFTAQSLNSRASILDALKDAMGQAISTIEAADKGMKAVTALIEQAKGIATAAQSAVAGTGFATQYVDLKGVVAGDTITVDGGDLVADTDFDVGATDAQTAINLAQAINEAAGATTVANVSGTRLYLEQADDMVLGDVTSVDASFSVSGIVPAVDDELGTLNAQVTSLLTQLDALVDDSGYKGLNLLSGGSLTVKFEGTTLTVNGFNAKAAGLSITTTTWATTADAATFIAELDAALTTMRSKSSALSSNLSIITARADFTTDIVNTLTNGANKLVMADTNEEGANMLMLQTRQSLSTTSLGLAAQSAQAVLRLFQ